MLAVLLHQLHHHAMEYRRLYLQAVEVSAPHEKTAPAGAASAEGGSSPSDDHSAPA
jgi:hypothetical protein